MIRASHSLTGPYTYVSKLDEAIDKDAPDFELKWEQYLDGQGDPPLRAGATPTVFTLKHLSMRQRAKLSAFTPAESVVVAAAMAIDKAKDWQDATGKPLKVSHQMEDDDRVASETTLELLGAELVGDIAMRVFRSLSPPPRD